MSKVVDAALAVKKAPTDEMAKARLDAARKEWVEKVQQLTAATDDIIDPEDFMAVSGTLSLTHSPHLSLKHHNSLSPPSIIIRSQPAEANIHQDMVKCRDAVRDGNWPLLRMLTQGVAAKAKRVADIGRIAADQVQEPWKKKALAVAGTKLENGMHILNHLSL